MRKRWARLRTFALQKVLHADDTPHSVALGAAIAMFVAILPVIGLQTVVAVALAALFRANKAVCIPIVWLSNPFTAIPIYYPCLAVGRLLWPSESTGTILQVIGHLMGVGGTGSAWTLSFWAERLRTLADLGVELWIGSLIVGAVLGAACYPLTLWGVTVFRERHRQRLARLKPLGRVHLGAKIAGQGEAA